MYFIKKIENIFNSKYGYAAAYTMVFIICFFIMLGQNFKLEAGNDDLYHTQVIKEFGSIYNFLTAQYNYTNGRYFTSIVMSFVMDKNIWLWRILNTIMLSLLFIYSAKIIQCFYKLNKEKFYIILFGFIALISLLPKGIWDWSITWVTGSFNYLFPATSLIICLFYLYNTLLNKNNINLLEFFLIIPFAAYATNSEQTALVFLTMFLIVMVYSYIKYKHYNIYIILIFICGIISSYFLFTSPSVHIRYASEVMRWYPMFDSMSLINKAVLGFSYTVIFGFLQYNYIMTIFYTIIMILLIRKSNKSKYHMILLFIPLLYSLVYYVGRQVSSSFRNWVGQSLVYNSELYAHKILNNTPSEPFISLIIGIILLIIMIYFLFKINWSSFESKYITFLFLGAAILSSFLVSFSPTVFASGFRIFFIPYVLYGISVGLMFAELINKISFPLSYKFKFIFLIYVIIGIIDVYSKVYK